MSLSIESMPVVACVGASAEAELRAALVDYRVFTLEHSVDNDDAFLGEADDVLPLPGGTPVLSWEGFADRLWNGLAELDADHVAILWRRGHETAAHGLQTLLTASMVLTDVARQVGTTEQGFPREMTLRVFVLGDGPSFPT